MAALCTERMPALFSERIAERRPNASIARPGAHVVGYCNHVGNRIDGVRGDERYRRRDIGTRLLADQLERLRDQGMPSAQASHEAFKVAAAVFSAIRAGRCWRKPPDHSPGT